MAEYIDRGELLKELERFPHLGTAGSIVRSMPKEDVVEVVRCKNCRYCEIRNPSKTINGETKEVHSCQVHWHMVLPDGYCSYGERKEQE